MVSLTFSNEIAHDMVQKILRAAPTIPLPEACLFAKAQIDRRTYHAVARTGSGMDKVSNGISNMGESKGMVEALLHLSTVAFDGLSTVSAGAQIVELQRASAQLMEKYLEALQLEFDAS